MSDESPVAALSRAVDEFLTQHNPKTTERSEFLRARFDAGLAWVHYPLGLGGQGLDPELQPIVDEAFAAAGAPDNAPHRNVIGLGMAAPTILRFASEELKTRWLKPLWTGEEIWCQLFSEPGAGSDLAAVSTRAVRDGDGWRVSGQKVWTSLAHDSSWALLVARSDPSQTKHRGLTYFVCDMSSDGVDVRPLRQLTGEAEFNEVFLDEVYIPDALRLGEPGQGWKVTQLTLMNERVAIGAGNTPREGGPIGFLARSWRESAAVRDPALYDDVLKLWVDAEAARLTTARLRQQMEAGLPGPEGSGAKLSYARLAQQVASLEVDIAGADGLRYDDYSMRRPDLDVEENRPAAYRFLRTKGNSIEGGTSEIMRNIIAERVLGLPAEQRVDVDIAWKDLPR